MLDELHLVDVAWAVREDLFHVHAHHGKYEGRTMRGVPVYNVAQFVLKPLLGRPYALLEI